MFSKEYKLRNSSRIFLQFPVTSYLLFSFTFTFSSILCSLRHYLFFPPLNDLINCPVKYNCHKITYSYVLSTNRIFHYWHLSALASFIIYVPVRYRFSSLRVCFKWNLRRIWKNFSDYKDVLRSYQPSEYGVNFQRFGDILYLHHQVLMTSLRNVTDSIKTDRASRHRTRHSYLRRLLTAMILTKNGSL
jgi:hypothetical protein